jgi:hypothetical protein
VEARPVAIVKAIAIQRSFMMTLSVNPLNVNAPHRDGETHP